MTKEKIKHDLQFLINRVKQAHLQSAVLRAMTAEGADYILTAKALESSIFVKAALDAFWVSRITLIGAIFADDPKDHTMVNLLKSFAVVDFMPENIKKSFISRIEQLIKFSEPIRKYRNKDIAHNDRNVRLGKLPEWTPTHGDIHHLIVQTHILLVEIQRKILGFSALDESLDLSELDTTIRQEIESTLAKVTADSCNHITAVHQGG